MRLDDLLRSGFQQQAVADIPAQSGERETHLANIGNLILDGSEPSGIVRPSPTRTCQSQTSGDRLVNVGESILFHATPGHAQPRKEAEIGQDRPLDIQLQPEFVAVLANRRGAWDLPGGFS